MKVAATEQARRTIAPAWHTWVLIGVLLLLAVQGGAGAGPSAAVPFYAGAIIFEWVLFAYVWWGLRLGGTSLATIVRRGGGATKIWREVAIGIGFWGFWYGVETLVAVGLRALGLGNASGAGTVFPHGIGQGVLWILLAASSGYCEEIAFRGYLQRQFTGWTGSVAAG
ncbi:MAG: hypothetical protein ACRD1Y_05040, partial [Terriglobales bacterium]